jgi:hypothetical protein
MQNEPQQSISISARMEGEPLLWYRRFMRFCLMFPRRTVAAIYSEEHPEETTKDDKRRQNAPGSWYEIAKQWQWEERAEAYDAAQFAEEEKIKQRVMRSGYALQHNRMLALQKHLEDLIAMAEEEKNIWIPEVRTFQSGKDSTSTVEKVQFNDPLFKEIREYLTDIADEMGERVKKKSISFDDPPANIYIGFDPDQDGTEERSEDGSVTDSE